MRPYKKTVIKAIILSLLFALISGFIPYLYGYAVDLISNNSPVFLVLALAGIWALTTLMSAFLRRAVSNQGGFIGADVLADFINRKINYIIDLPLSFHREKKVGEILSMVTRGAESLMSIIDDIIFWIFPQLLSVVVGLFILVFINWGLALGFSIIFLSSLIYTLFSTKTLVKGQTALNKKFDKGTGYINDSLLNIQTIKSTVSERFQEALIADVYKKELAADMRKVVLLWNNAVFFQEIIYSVGFLFMFGYAIFLLGAGKISNGVLVMFLGYLNIVRAPLMTLVWQWFHFQRGMSIIKRAREFLEIKKENKNEKGLVFKKISGRVDYQNVSFSYPGGKKVLDRVSFNVEPGQKVALIGGSGEGKTTTVDLLSLYFIPGKGRILIDGADIRSFRLDFLRSIIASVPQEIILFNTTIKNNILYGRPEAANQDIIKAAKTANIHKFIDSLPNKYNTMVGERGVKLSMGQKQRLAIARVVISRPKILVLDEATSSLDAKSEKLIQEALEQLEKNKTTFIIAHRLSTVRKADKILVLNKGRIAEQGNHRELMKKKGIYFKFYNLQFSRSAKTKK